MGGVIPNPLSIETATPSSAMRHRDRIIKLMQLIKAFKELNRKFLRLGTTIDHCT
jgi:hypothetical protein